MPDIDDIDFPTLDEARAQHAAALVWGTPPTHERTNVPTDLIDGHRLIDHVDGWMTIHTGHCVHLVPEPDDTGSHTLTHDCWCAPRERRVTGLVETWGPLYQHHREAA